MQQIYLIQATSTWLLTWIPHAGGVVIDGQHTFARPANYTHTVHPQSRTEHGMESGAMLIELRFRTVHIWTWSRLTFMCQFFFCRRLSRAELKKPFSLDPHLYSISFGAHFIRDRWDKRRHGPLEIIGIPIRKEQYNHRAQDRKVLGCL
jgi:hypothetical protein